MTLKSEASATSSARLVAELGRRLDAIRLSRNIKQADLARDAGVSRSTLTRLAEGKPVSLDSFVRIMQALGLEGHLAALLPDPGIRPVDRARLDGGERRRARREKTPASDWTWGNAASEDDA